MQYTPTNQKNLLKLFLSFSNDFLYFVFNLIDFLSFSYSLFFLFINNFDLFKFKLFLEEKSELIQVRINQELQFLKCCKSKMHEER